MKIADHPVLLRLVGLLVGGVFLYASIDKIRHPADFARIVYHYQLIGPSAWIPPLVPNLFAVTLPWIEALTGLLLILGVWRREASLVVAALLAVFIFSLSAAMVRGIDLANCGCFSVGDQGRGAGALLIIEDTALLAGALFLMRRNAAKPVAAGSTTDS